MKERQPKKITIKKINKTDNSHKTTKMRIVKNIEYDSKKRIVGVQ